MSRINTYRKYFEEYSEISETFCYDGIKYLVMREVHGNEYIIASMDICEGNESDIVNIDGLDINVIKVSSIIKGIEDMPCLAFFINVNTRDEYSFILDLSDCDLSNILDMRITPYSASGSINTYNIIYPKGSMMLRPVRADGVINCVKYREVIKSIDFSDLWYADDFLRGSKIEYFNFDDMDTRNLVSMTLFFEYCDKLKRVDGNIKSEKPLDISAMFSGCTALEILDENIFHGCRISKMNSLFNHCEVLKNKPLCEDNVKGMNVAPRLTYSFSNANDSERMFEVTCASLGSAVEFPFRGVSGIFKAGKANIDMQSIVGIFNESKFSLIDMSEVKFNDTFPSILCIFLNPEIIKDDEYWDGEYWDDDYCENHYLDIVMDSLDDKVDYELNLRKFLGLPDVLIVNSSVRIHPKDSTIFEIVNVGDNIDYIDTKINLIRMFGCKKKVLTICR